jgi:hypothetical protein
MNQIALIAFVRIFTQIQTISSQLQSNPGELDQPPDLWPLGNLEIRVDCSTPKPCKMPRLQHALESMSTRSGTLR